jgi:Tfp pilus assembly protein PilV
MSGRRVSVAEVSRPVVRGIAGAAIAMAVVALSASGCGRSAPPPPNQSSPNNTATATSRAATPTSTTPPAPQTIDISGTDWTSYSGTIYWGCSGSVENSGGNEKIHPRIFDTATGKFITPAVPTAAPGEAITNEACVVTGSAPDLRIIYTVHTTKPASGLSPEVDKKTAYIYDLNSPSPLATKDISGFETYYDLMSTSTGAVVTGANGLGTQVLSNSDLSVLWTDPENATGSDDTVVALPRHKDNNQAKFDGLELRAPNGESIYRDANGNGASIFSEGPTHLVLLTIWKSYSPGILVTSYFDVNSRTLLNINGSVQLPNGVNSTVSSGRLFMEGITPIGGQGGMSVWNLQTHQMEFQKTPDQTKDLHIDRVNYFQDHLYIGTGSNPETFSVFKLPDETTPIATTWTSRPAGHLTGWTQVCKNELSSGGSAQKCDLLLVKDQNGGYPGPWR